MAYGLTWTGLSETLVTGRGAAGSPLSRKGLLRPTDKTTIRAVIAATCCRRCNSVRERWSSIGRAASPGARRIFCGLSTRCVAAEAFREMKIDPMILPAELTVGWLTTFL